MQVIAAYQLDKPYLSIATAASMDGIEYQNRPVSHGTCVALGTLTILSLHEWLLKQDFQNLETHRVIRHRRRLGDLAAEIQQRFISPDIAQPALQEVRAKYIEDDLLRECIELIKQIWSGLRQRLADDLTKQLTVCFRMAVDGAESSSVMSDR